MYKTKEKNKGISLIVLVITIIVVIIIAAAVILTLTANNPIAEARKATFLSDIDAFKSELDMYNTTQYATTMGNYDLTSADFSVTADENMLYTVIPSLKGKTKYRSHFEVIDGGLAYTGIDEEKIDLAKNVAGIMTTNAKPEIALTTSNILPVKSGASVTYTVTMTGTMPITIANLTGNVKVLNNAGAEITTQPSLSIGTVSGTTADKERSAVVTINTTGMADGTYKIKVLAEAVQTVGSKSAEKISTATFEIDNTAPAMPTITINPTTWTNGNVTATITKSNEADTLEYSTNGTTWNAYTTNLTITSNSTVYARETDAASNVSNVATQVITIIDKTAPIASWGTPSKTTMTNADTVTIPLTFTETGSGMKASTVNTTSVTVQKTGITTATLNLSGSGNSYTATINGITGTGSFTLTATTAITDNANNVIGSTVVSSVITVNQQVIISNTYTFTNASVTGPIGPTQAQLNTAYASTSLAGSVTSSNGIQLWTVPITSNYIIEAYGAQAGSKHNNGANGAKMVGTFYLTQGTQLKILVGQSSYSIPTTDVNSGTGGGGGTFVTKSDNTPLIVAGGGGGVAYTDLVAVNGHGVTTNSGTGSNGSLLAGTGVSSNGNGGYAAGAGAGGGGRRFLY